MQPFRILEHTADVGFEAFGATREETFANAARALFFLITDLESIEPRKRVVVMEKSSDAASLLVDWLSQLLYLHDGEGWLFSDFRVGLEGDTELVAEARGEKLDPARHQMKLLVKAITYHQLAFEQTPERWRAQVYVDI
ncbi:MAG: archease [Acidobacteriia bacterium]|nr:archease [Terriglobia bacterium]